MEENSDSKQKVKVDNPERVLKDVYGTLEKLKRKGYGFADEIQKTMTIIVSNVLRCIYIDNALTCFFCCLDFDVSSSPEIPCGT